MSGQEQEPTFGAKLRQLRVDAALTQDMLAERAGMSVNAIGALERGVRRSPYPSTVSNLAKALKLSAAHRDALMQSVVPRRPGGSREELPFARRVPREATPLVGRDDEIVDIGSTLRGDKVRLLTLTGPGGVGKSRLATRVALELESDIAGGVWFVQLAAVSDADLVPGAIAQVMGIQPGPPHELIPVLAEAMGDQPVLLVLDNVEQVATAAKVMSRLLQECGQLKLLVTSRIAMRIAAEYVHPVAPLALPSVAETRSLSHLERVPSVRLFVQRAQAARPGFTLTSENADAVAELCARLDGLPLAIELAAAWSRTLTPAALLEYMPQRLDVLSDGGPDRPLRQQTMRNAIDWSHDLLQPDSQFMFQALSVQAGSLPIEAAEAIARTMLPGRSRIQQLQSISRLVDHSLLWRDETSAGDLRVGMLETIREYAMEHLATADDGGRAAHAAHAEWFLNLATLARPQLEGVGRRAAYVQIQADMGNMRLALSWFLDQGDADRASRLANELARFWTNLGYLDEGRQWMERILAMEPAPVADVRFESHYWAAIIARLQNQNEASFIQIERALALARSTNHQLGIAMATLHLGELTGLTNIEASRELFRRSLAMFVDLHEPFREATAYRQLGEAAIREGSYTEAIALHRRALAVLTEIEHPWGMSISLRSLADCALATGDFTEARVLYRESIARWLELGERLPLSNCLQGLSRVELSSGHVREAILLMAARDRLDRDMGYFMVAGDVRTYLRELEVVADGLPFAAIWDEGRAMSLESVLEHVADVVGE